MICCLIMISMQCCCRYYLHPRQEDWLYYTSADTVSWQDTTPDRMTGRWVTISQEAAGVSSVSPCQLSGRRRVHITHHMPAGGRGDTLVYTFIITYSGQFPAQGLHFWEGPPSHMSTTFTKPYHLLLKKFVLAFNVSTLSTNKQSSQRAVVFNPTCVSIIYIHGKGHTLLKKHWPKKYILV